MTNTKVPRKLRSLTADILGTSLPVDPIPADDIAKSKRWTALTVGRNRKVTILGGARSCMYPERLHCNQLRDGPLLEKPWQRVVCREGFVGTKGKQLRQYAALR
ncbi:UNVERIFIED_CONTAM: hypothetical protein FKN15_075701 [Acipenser sinensis]